MSSSTILLRITDNHLELDNHVQHAEAVSNRAKCQNANIELHQQTQSLTSLT